MGGGTPPSFSWGMENLGGVTPPYENWTSPKIIKTRLGEHPPRVSSNQNDRMDMGNTWVNPPGPKNNDFIMIFMKNLKIVGAMDHGPAMVGGIGAAF